MNNIHVTKQSEYYITSFGDILKLVLFGFMVQLSFELVDNRSSQLCSLIINSNLIYLEINKS